MATTLWLACLLFSGVAVGSSEVCEQSCIQATALLQQQNIRSASSTKTIIKDEVRRNRRVNTTIEYANRKVLFVAYSDSIFYSTRTKALLDTWGSLIPKSHLIVVGDTELEGEPRIRASGCPKHDHWRGACCKYAAAVIQANRVMQQDPSFEWAVFVDDDVYLRPEQYMDELLQETEPQAEGYNGVILANTYTCVSGPCTGLCGGAGYVANAAAVKSLVGLSEQAFMREQMESCERCNTWADLAMDQQFEARNLEKREWERDGVYPNTLSKEQFDQTLSNVHWEPMLYHNIKTQEMFSYLHSLLVEQPSGALPNSVDDSSGTCSTFKGFVHCAESKDDHLVPWCDEKFPAPCVLS